MNNQCNGSDDVSRQSICCSCGSCGGEDWKKTHLGSEHNFFSVGVDRPHKCTVLWIQSFYLNQFFINTSFASVDHR